MKIDLDWIKKELDAGRKVELEYLGGISNYGHAGEYARFLESAGTVTVDGIENGCLNIKNTWYVIDDEYLKHFRIKRTSNYDPIEGEGTLPSLNLQGKGTPIYSEINFPDSDPDLSDKPTFNDLIDVAIQAYKDGVIKSLKLLDYGVHSLSYSINADANGDENTIFSQHKDYSNGINFINSLYTETFVIESEGDLKGLFTVDENMTITTVNGSVFRFGDFGNLIVLGTSALFKLIKGATVIRKRGGL